MRSTEVAEPLGLAYQLQPGDIGHRGQIAGSDAISVLESRRPLFPETGEYRFLIGDTEELERVKEAAEFNDQSFDDIFRGALDIDLQNAALGHPRINPLGSQVIGSAH